MCKTKRRVQCCDNSKVNNKTFTACHRWPDTNRRKGESTNHSNSILILFSLSRGMSLKLAKLEKKRFNRFKGWKLKQMENNLVVCIKYKNLQFLICYFRSIACDSGFFLVIILKSWIWENFKKSNRKVMSWLSKWNGLLDMVNMVLEIHCGLSRKVSQGVDICSQGYCLSDSFT
jgi:hypothetical protein